MPDLKQAIFILKTAWSQVSKEKRVKAKFNTPPVHSSYRLAPNKP